MEPISTRPVLLPPAAPAPQRFPVSPKGAIRTVEIAAPAFGVGVLAAAAAITGHHLLPVAEKLLAGGGVSGPEALVAGLAAACGVYCARLGARLWRTSARKAKELTEPRPNATYFLRAGAATMPSMTALLLTYPQSEVAVACALTSALWAGVGSIAVAAGETKALRAAAQGGQADKKDCASCVG